jgi:hypothetical protein
MALHPAGSEYYWGENIFLIPYYDAIFISFGKKCQGQNIPQGNFD